MNRIAHILNVSTPAVLRWIKSFGEKLGERPQVEGDIIVLEVGEMWHYINSKKNKLWIWKAYDRHTNRLIDWICGDRSHKTLRRPLDRLSRLKIHFFCADQYEAYQTLIPENKLYLRKDKTHAIERNNCLQRHWLARFKRKSIVVSKSVKMVDVSIALFTAIHINKSFIISDLSIC